MDNETKISLTFKNNVGGEKKLERYQERLEKLYALIGGLNGTSAQSAMQSLTKSANLAKTQKPVQNIPQGINAVA